jgi:hypothetical protein
VDLWPFLTERARERAPKVLEYAAATGSAALVSPQGEVVLAHFGADLEATCVHTIPVCHGWSLLVSVPAGMTCLGDRLRKASRVLALALTDAPRPEPPDGAQGAPAMVFAYRDRS